MNGKPNILISRRLPHAVEARLLRDYRPHFNHEDRHLPTVELLARVEETKAEALLITPSERLTADVIERLPERVCVIATFSVGFDHIDLPACAARGIVVTNTPGVLTDATADLAMLLILAAARRAGEGERLVRAGAWTGWTPTQLLGTHLGGRRLGIVGMGRIGQALACRARAFGMTVLYHNRRRLPEDQEGQAVYHQDPDTLLADSDVLSLHCPASPDTLHWLNAARIARLPHGAIVVNTARGAVVDDAALISALQSGRVAAAGLDVYDGEPKVNAGYLALENAVLLPHLGSATVDTRNAMGFRALDNLDAFFAGHEPPHRVA